MPESVFLIRHAQSTFNAVHDTHGVDPGHRDAPLTPFGHEQVNAARTRVRHLSPELVLTSPLTRALETCDGLFGALDAPVVVEPLLAEQLASSCDVGRSPGELAAEFPRWSFDHLEDPWWFVGPGDGLEPIERFERRVQRFMQALGERRERTVAVVGHAGFFGAIVGRRLANCEIVSLRQPAVAGARAGARRAARNAGDERRGGAGLHGQREED